MDLRRGHLPAREQIVEIAAFVGLDESGLGADGRDA